MHLVSSVSKFVCRLEVVAHVGAEGGGGGEGMARAKARERSAPLEEESEEDDDVVALRDDLGWG